MRLHLIIQRHGLPLTRILWTTSSTHPSHVGPHAAASSSVITSTRAPNAAYGNGGYTIAQFLEDVNEVVPLETADKPWGENDEFGGQWGLEDYAVEVGGFECLHFMEVEGLLRDGDEVVIRALQTADIRARRLSGRVQVSTEGRHLIDGVPFGRPYLKRPFSSRPAIRIPSRKRRRTTFSCWDDDLHQEDGARWTGRDGENTRRELLMLDEASIPSSDRGTVIRHPVTTFDNVQESDSDADTSDLDEDEDLNEELKDLREDLNDTGALDITDSESPRALRSSGRVSRLTHRSPTQATVEASPTRLSSVFASPSRSESVIEPSPKSSKMVRFEESSDKEDLSSMSDDLSDDSSDSEGDSSSEVELDESSDASSPDYSTSESSDASLVSDSESEDEMVPFSSKVKPQVKYNPPGKGNEKTKKTNRRHKLRRRLAKLKELGYLPPDANFAVMRAWEAENGVGPLREVTDISEGRSSQKHEQSEFEAKRQKLLRELESGGIDVDGHSEKENIPPRYRNGCLSSSPAARESGPNPESTAFIDQEAEYPDAAEEETSETIKRQKLDVASSRRLLFGSLGVKTPKSKEDEEVTRKKLAKSTTKLLLPTQKDVSQETADEGAGSDIEENWQEKLVVQATECVFEDVVMNPPPFPFHQRWNPEALELIRQRKNSGISKKTRKRKRRGRQEEEDNAYEGYSNGDTQFNYDDELSHAYVNGASEGATENQPLTPLTEDLPLLPENLASVPALVEEEVGKGAIIAYKQLDMSRATNWQPKISEYRVATIEGVLEDGIISLRLAIRDREQIRMHEDDDDDREYSGFEMPGFDDEVSEDDGFYEVSFGELIEPKLLQPAVREESAQVVENGENASLSDSEDALGPNVHDQISAEAATPSIAIEVPVVSSQTRHEISQIMRDAGFRSSINSDLLGPPLDDSPVVQAGSQHDESAEGESEPSPMVESPTFSGFSSSPPDVESSRRSVVEHARHEDEDDDVGDKDDFQSFLPNSPTRLVTNEAKSTQDDPAQPPTSYQLPQSSQFLDEAPGAQAVIDYPQLPSMSGGSGLSLAHSVASQLDGTVEMLVDDDFVDSPLEEVTESIAEKPDSGRTPSRAGTRREINSSHSDTSSTVPNPFYERDKAYLERSGQTVESQNSEMQEPPVDAELFELPSLEALFASTAPPRDTKNPVSPNSKPKRNALSSPRQLPSSSGPIQNGAWDTTSPAPSSQPPQFKGDRRSTSPPLGTQVVVDLTLSSPPESPGGSDEDFAKSQQLPKGPGWVQKNVPNTRRQTRSSIGANGRDTDENSLSISAPRRKRGGRLSR